MPLLICFKTTIWCDFRRIHWMIFCYLWLAFYKYSKTCVRQPPLKLTLVVDVERWLSYKGTCHVSLLAKLHAMYLYKTDNFFHIKHYFKSVSKVALLHRFYCTLLYKSMAFLCWHSLNVCYNYRCIWGAYNMHIDCGNCQNMFYFFYLTGIILMPVVYILYRQELISIFYSNNKT